MSRTRNDVSPEAAALVTSRAKVQTRRALPFDKLSADAPRDRAFRFETNAYEREVFKYLAVVRGKGESVADVIRLFARERALQELGKVPEPLSEVG